MNKNFLIVYCHPYDNSFNHAELLAIKSNLNKHNIKFNVIDLYNDNFNPVYDNEELSLFHLGKTHDSLVIKYLKLLKESTDIIFITPIWWNSIPGMLKGFIDKVMKEGKGLTHTITKTGVKGLLNNLKHTYVFTTSTTPTFYFKLAMGNSIKKIFINKTLKQLGMKHIKWFNFGGITNSKITKRKRYLYNLNNLKLS
ncbi:flavodoxin family protein [Apilactobacillus timberlakei]|uniref:NAD(P)H-dependent oxidoreductase n=1 Tax=Apilactobacillus timberlakei TaxID=2008380 RepID=UPI00112D9057|nr:NAD(P)H-dependent oxidoreductase [Apilactobacillus timberlakei]TPR19552.1 flavodoxin family protein [Apilactobacillus timberlakei]TPR20529.1 flavodoxin family protein [Apilactobacillus timberlakei]TPR22573.1 flavodoxin family protein [Apilactobacillus timberlakei]